MTSPVVAGVAHAAALAAIHAEAFPPSGRWGADAMALQLSLPGVLGWIDPAGGMILVRVVADESEVLTLAVGAETRRCGMGRRLLLLAMEAARVRGAVSMVLEVGVENDAARRLYLSSGFTEVGLRRGYYGGGADALIMRAPLSG